MAASVNKVILVGTLGADPELRSMPSGGSVANIESQRMSAGKIKKGTNKSAQSGIAFPFLASWPKFVDST